MSRFNLKVNRKSLSYTLGAAAAAGLLIFLVLSFESWLLGMILSWFAVQLNFWQCFTIVTLLNCFLGTRK